MAFVPQVLQLHTRQVEEEGQILKDTFQISSFFKKIRAFKKIIVVLIYDYSYTIQSNHLKYAIQSFLVYLYSCATITVNFRTFSSAQRETLFPFEVTFHFLPNPQP